MEVKHNEGGKGEKNKKERRKRQEKGGGIRKGIDDNEIKEEVER